MKLGEFPERIWRVLFLLAALFALATITRSGPRPPPPGPGYGAIVATPIALDAGDPARRDVGALHFLAGWTLTSADLRFGGISGLHVEAGEISAISDLGILLRFPAPGADARLPIRFAPFEEGPGPRVRKSNRDTEGLLIRGDALWASFERHNMIWRYDRASLRATASARPPAMRRWGGNRGPEALVRLADGRFLVFAEGRDDGSDSSEAVLFAGDPAVEGTPATSLRYRRPTGFRATDAALLPDGRILILNRRFSWWGGWSARLVVAEIGNSEIGGREVAALEAPLTVDNMEGLSVTREGGRTIVWLASDDNYSPLQRTLLLKFELRL
jgi:hypothetical protein